MKLPSHTSQPPIAIHRLTLITLSIVFLQLSLLAKNIPKKPDRSSTKAWVNKTFQQLTPRERVAQLIILRAYSNLGPEHYANIAKLIKEENIGGLCFFQGGPLRQAILTNQYQSIAKTPLLICTDAEWGLGMRLDSIDLFPKQMTLGATGSPKLAYKVGRAIGRQCKRMGIHINFAPVADVNSNPLNPVINDRSFGENPQKVSTLTVAIMNGIQSKGVLACGKHFPGHGDASVDSHIDLPLIQKSLNQLENMELIPFKSLIASKVACIMTAHLSVPAIDSTLNWPTSLSQESISGLLKNKLQYSGLIVTDGLEMKGVAKYFPNGQSSVEALIAGNDLLLMPPDPKEAIDKILDAIATHKLSQDRVDSAVKKVLLAKYLARCFKARKIDTVNLLGYLNHNTEKLVKKVAAKSLTIIKNNSKTLFPIPKGTKTAYVGFGMDNKMEQQPKLYGMDTYSQAPATTIGQELMDDTVHKNITALPDTLLIPTWLKQLKNNRYQAIVVGIHNMSRKSANNYGLDKQTIDIVNKLSQQDNVFIIIYGNPYSLKNFCTAKNIMVAYEDNIPTQKAALEWLQGNTRATATLPVSVSQEWNSGYGIKN